MPGPKYGPALKEICKMLGLIAAILWIALIAALSVKWDATGQPPVTTAKMADGVHLDVHSPVHGKVRSAGLLAIGIGLTPFWFIFGNNCFLTIPPAHVAAVYDPLRGGVQSDVLPEGFHIVMPWWQTQQFSQQTQEYTMSGSTQARGGEEQSQTDESISCQTNEGLNVQIDCTVLFHIDPQHAQNVWMKLGEDTTRLIVRPYTHNIMRMVVAKYSVEDVYTSKRKEIETEITDQMKPLYAEKGLVLEQLLMRNVIYGNPAFAEAINAKQVAQQQVQTEGQKLLRAKVEKQTIVAEAQGEASAISKRGATLRANPEVVQYEFVQKVAPRLKTMYLSPNSLPIPKGGQ
jgi:regulator of protease activity HflC (stomatin/prohibitin superfamily)